MLIKKEKCRSILYSFRDKDKSKRHCGESKSGRSILSYSKDEYNSHRPYGGQEILSESMHSRKCEEKMLQKIKYDQGKSASQDDED